MDKVDTFCKVSVTRQLNHFLGNVSRPVDTCCHGDFWSNNIMFNYGAEGKVSKSILVDFQMINFGHTAYEVLYMLYISTDMELRNAYMAECLATYWTIAFVLATTLLPNALSGSQISADGVLAPRPAGRFRRSRRWSWRTQRTSTAGRSRGGWWGSARSLPGTTSSSSGRSDGKNKAILYTITIMHLKSYFCHTPDLPILPSPAIDPAYGRH